MSFLEPPPKPSKQLDFRAWMIAGAILLLIAVAYVVWINRPRAGYTGRSLSASANHSESKPVTKSLHIDGCHEDFIVNPGELVEPRLAPGAPIDQFLSIYGQELAGKELASKGLPNQLLSTHQWNTEALQLAVSEPGPASTSQHPARIQMSLNSGHIVESLDGIELGLDSFGTILRKMRDKKVEIHQRIRRVQNNDPTKPDHWILTVSIYSSCGKTFRSEYFRSIPSDPETDRQINRREVGANGQPGALRSDIFMNKVAYDYILETANGSDDDPAAGEPAERE